MRSPKNKFRVEITYGKALSGIGSVSSFTCNELDENHSMVAHHLEQAKKAKTSLLIVWKENKAEYPSFDWVEVKRKQEHFIAE
jgi:hypothetical protein